jgi:hypothetical protein
MRPKSTITSILAFVSLSAALAFLAVRSPAQKVEPGRIYNRFSVNEANRPLRGHPIMISAATAKPCLPRLLDGRTAREAGMLKPPILMLGVLGLYGLF